MIVGDYLNERVIAAPPNETVAYVRNLMLKHRVGRVVIVEEDSPVGIVTKKDLARSLAMGRAKWRRRPIDKILIKRIASKNLVTIGKGQSLKKASRLMLSHGISSLIVTEQGKLVGIITKTDLVRAYAENYTGKFRVRDLMSSRLITANPNNTINHLIDLMEENGISRVLITHNSRLVGIVTSSDLSFALLEVKDREITYLRRARGKGRAMLRAVKYLPILTAGDVMTKQIVTILPEQDAVDAAKLMLDKKISGLPVVGKDELVGIVTKTDIVEGIAK